MSDKHKVVSFGTLSCGTLALALMAASSNGASAQEAEAPRTRSVTVIGSPQSDKAISEALPKDNAANVSIEILPKEHMEIGSKVLFKVTTQKSGYLILLDVDARGRVTQIYPNLYSMSNPGNATMLIPAGATESANLMKPGKPVLIPDMGNPLARFEYVVEPPSGQGVIIALLSQKPAHMVDIPDVPQDQLDPTDEVRHVYNAAKALRLAEGNARLADPQWSFEAKVYKIMQAER